MQDIALYTGISTDAEEILIPERKESAMVASLITRLKMAMKKGKRHYIIVNAEGVGNSSELVKELEKETRIETRATILGYLQRGCSSSCWDRVLASMMGVNSVNALISGKRNRIIVVKNGIINDINIEEGLNMKKND